MPFRALKRPLQFLGLFETSLCRLTHIPAYKVREGVGEGKNTELWDKGRGWAGGPTVSALGLEMELGSRDPTTWPLPGGSEHVSFPGKW